MAKVASSGQEIHLWNMILVRGAFNNYFFISNQELISFTNPEQVLETMADKKKQTPDFMK